MRTRSTAVAGLAAAAVLLPALPSQAASGFSYMEPVASGVELTPILTAGDKVGGVQWQGVPDGIGVLRDGNGLVLLVNHELSASSKAANAQKRAGGGASAATVSAVNVDPATKSVTAVRDLLGSVAWFDYSTGQYSSKPVAPAGAAKEDEFKTPLHTTALNRFCSSHLAKAGDLAYRTKVDGKDVTYGFTGPVYFTGEEGGDESRAFAMSTTGNMVQLPKLGLAAWENFIAAPKTGIRTVVMGNEDGSATDRQLFMYVGEKKAEGDWVEKAGLTNGQNYVMSIDGVANDNAFRTQKGKNNPVSVSWKPIDTSLNGKMQNEMARALGSTLARVEDGAFDPKAPNDYYFVTTESNKDAKATAPNPATPKVSRDGGALWRLRFNDVANPLAGATITMLLDGSEAPYLNKPDNIDVDAKGNVLIQEDPGNNDHVARLVAYRISDGKIGTVAKFKDAYFAPGGAQFITKDEESSGITDITSLMAKDQGDQNSYFVLDAQVHQHPVLARPDLVLDKAGQEELAQAIEGGQLYMLTVSDWNKVYA